MRSSALIHPPRELRKLVLDHSCSQAVLNQSADDLRPLHVYVTNLLREDFSCKQVPTQVFRELLEMLRVCRMKVQRQLARQIIGLLGWLFWLQGYFSSSLAYLKQGVSVSEQMGLSPLLFLNILQRVTEVRPALIRTITLATQNLTQEDLLLWPKGIAIQDNSPAFTLLQKVGIIRYQDGSFHRKHWIVCFSTRLRTVQFQVQISSYLSACKNLFCSSGTVAFLQQYPQKFISIIQQLMLSLRLHGKRLRWMSEGKGLTGGLGDSRFEVEEREGSKILCIW